MNMIWQMFAKQIKIVYNVLINVKFLVIDLIKKCRFILIILLMALALYFLDVKCVFKMLYGVSCPGCCLTRAYKSFTSLNIQSALYYHSLFWTVPIIIYFYIKRVESKYLLTFLLMYLVVYVIRLFDNKCDIVTIDLDGF